MSSVTPSGGPTMGGTYVTVFGAGFAVFSDPLRTPKCKFGVTVDSLHTHPHTPAHTTPHTPAHTTHTHSHG